MLLSEFGMMHRMATGVEPSGWAFIVLGLSFLFDMLADRRDENNSSGRCLWAVLQRLAGIIADPKTGGRRGEAFLAAAQNLVRI